LEILTEVYGKDQLASHYLKQLDSNQPLTPPVMATKPQNNVR
jgi:hypothetical protein